MAITAQGGEVSAFASWQPPPDESVASDGATTGVADRGGATTATP